MSVVNDSPEQLRSFIERLEKLNEEKADIGDFIKDVLLEARATGFDTKAIKQVLKIRKQDKDKRETEQAILETYLSSLGIQ